MSHVHDHGIYSFYFSVPAPTLEQKGITREARVEDDHTALSKVSKVYGIDPLSSQCELQVGGAVCLERRSYEALSRSMSMASSSLDASEMKRLWRARLFR